MKKSNIPALSLLDPALIYHLVSKLSKTESAFEDPLDRLICSDHLQILSDFEVSGLQSNLAWYSAKNAREIAALIVDERGDIDSVKLELAITLLKENLYCYYKSGFDFSNKHLLFMLERLKDPKMKEVIKSVHGPYSPREEGVIRKTLRLSTAERVTDKRAKEALLSALFTPLRQRLGSCFATQSAIFVQREKSERFLRELKFLTERDYLPSISDGIEYQIPFCPSGGAGELFTPFLFWEKDFYELAKAPGLLAALAAISLEDKIVELLEPIAKEVALHPFETWNADRLLTRMLQHHFHVKDEEIERFKEQEERKNIALSLAGGSFTAKRGDFFDALEKAKEAFISLSENYLLRSWEYTLASFAEIKGDVATWNLFHSLGMDSRQKGGIGAAIKSALENYLQGIQGQITHYDLDYERLNSECALYEKNIAYGGHYQASYFAKRAELDRVQREREELYDKARRVASSLGFFIEFYITKLKDYFQEIYDPKIEGEVRSLLDDRPSGFRLYYKHGRQKPSTWTAITTPRSYVESLAAFFGACEVMLSHEKMMNGLHDLVTLVTGELLSFLHHRDFLENSLERLYSAYQEPMTSEPLKNLSKLKRVPWSYISGGNLETFLFAYKPEGERYKKIEIAVESPIELLTFYIEAVKDIPSSLKKRVEEDDNSSLLAFSPTHAFLFKPVWLKKAFESQHYSRTWVSDQIKEKEAFLFSQILDQDKVKLLLDDIEQQLIPSGYRLLFRGAAKQIGYPLSVMEFGHEVMRVLSYEWWMKEPSHRLAMEKAVTGLLYRKLPLHSCQEVEKKLLQVFESFECDLSNSLKTVYEERQKELRGVSLFSADRLLLMLRGMLMMATGQTRGPDDLMRTALLAMRKNQLCYPEPLLFADSNWPEVKFGFTLSPMSGALELFGFDEWGQEGFPLLEWAPYLEGRGEGKWGLFIPY